MRQWISANYSGLATEVSASRKDLVPNLMPQLAQTATDSARSETGDLQRCLL